MIKNSNLFKYVGAEKVIVASFVSTSLDNYFIKFQNFSLSLLLFSKFSGYILDSFKFRKFQTYNMKTKHKKVNIAVTSIQYPAT